VSPEFPEFVPPEFNTNKEGSAMNAERLGLIIKAVREDMAKISVVDKIQSVITALSNHISAPNEEHQKQISAARKDLANALRQSEFSKFPRTWRNTLEELGIYHLLGDQLSEVTDEIFQRNQITQDVARDEIQEIHQTLTQYDTAFDHILKGFTFLEIESEGPGEGEAELSIQMPTNAFDNELKMFAAEIKFFDHAIRFFSEVGTGSRETPRIKQLSSSEPTLLVSTGVAGLGVLLWAARQILDLMTKTEALRNAKHVADKAGAEARITNMIEKQIRTEIEAGLVGVTDSLIKDYTGAKPRRAELKTEGEKILKGLATRLDNGYQLEGDVGEMEQEQLADGQEPDKERAEKVKLIKDVKQLAYDVRYSDVPNKPVLHLPKPGEEENEGDEDAPQGPATS
jgi:hypothetical protein